MNHASRVLIASATLANNSSSAVVLVSLTALPTMRRQRSMSLSPSSASSGILATAWSTILYASGSRNESMVLIHNELNYLFVFILVLPRSSICNTLFVFGVILFDVLDHALILSARRGNLSDCFLLLQDFFSSFFSAFLTLPGSRSSISGMTSIFAFASAASCHISFIDFLPFLPRRRAKS